MLLNSSYLDLPKNEPSLHTYDWLITTIDSIYSFRLKYEKFLDVYSNMKVYSFPEFVYYYIYLHSDQHKRRIINEKSWDFLYTLNHYDNNENRYVIVFCSFFRVYI